MIMRLAKSFLLPGTSVDGISMTGNFQEKFDKICAACSCTFYWNCYPPARRVKPVNAESIFMTVAYQKCSWLCVYTPPTMFNHSIRMWIGVNSKHEILLSMLYLCSYSADI